MSAIKNGIGMDGENGKKLVKLEMVLRMQKKLAESVFHYVAIPMMTLQILKYVDFTKT